MECARSVGAAALVGVGVLRRAALRQEKMNVRGQAVFDELQQRKATSEESAIRGNSFFFRALWAIASLSYGFGEVPRTTDWKQDS